MSCITKLTPAEQAEIFAKLFTAAASAFNPAVPAVVPIVPPVVPAHDYCLPDGTVVIKYANNLIKEASPVFKRDLTQGCPPFVGDCQRYTAEADSVVELINDDFKTIDGEATFMQKVECLIPNGTKMTKEQETFTSGQTISSPVVCFKLPIGTNLKRGSGRETTTGEYLFRFRIGNKLVQPTGTKLSFGKMKVTTDVEEIVELAAPIYV